MLGDILASQYGLTLKAQQITQNITWKNFQHMHWSDKYD